MERRSKTCLITGGLGFIGLNVTKDLIRHGWNVTLFDNLSPQIHGVLPSIENEVFNAPQVEIMRGDVRDVSLLKVALLEADAVIHLAAETGTAQSMYQVAHYNAVNSQATASLMDILANEQHSIKKIVLASSRSIYGEGAYLCEEHGMVFPSPRTLKEFQAGQWDPRCPLCHGSIFLTPTSESTPPSPASIYAATKLAQEDIVRISGAAFNIDTVVLRLQNVYGAGQSLHNPYTGILSIFSTRIRRGMNLPIFEDGLESRDFVHVNDVARAFRLALTSDAVNGRIINIGEGKPTSVMDIANLLVDKLDGKIRPEVTGQYRLGDIRHCYADLTQASTLLGYSPEISIDKGLDQFVDWVLSQPLPDDGLDKANEELRKRRMME
ncbi:MAG: NAD-dependent epimerase/dehydratase family protein [Proteobacteria bacterium]|nr:NAD-dependent epimerase/dehydratase family protein [Desulfobulbaceae bacterium]MBU4152025.1 NAD-dependent epimerase/dehydratase family protein [Pseudomonadota bacterium]